MTQSKKPKDNILVIDDQINNLQLLGKILLDEGYTVRLAPNVSLALSSIKARLPDLILLDIKMPDRDGYTVSQILKNNRETADIPIIFISGLSEVGEKTKAFELGAVDYITKPFQAKEVLARVKTHLKLRRLQQQLIQVNNELRISNQELEKFAYVVAHDLKQPLQSIIGFAKIIDFKYGDQLPREVVEYLNHILRASNNQQEMIQGLLAYARLETEKEFQLVDCNEVLNEVVNNLQGIIRKKQAQISYTSLPTLRGNKIQLIQLWQNLIANGIKFVSFDTIPQIKIGVEDREENWLFSCQDNGIGIKPEMQDKVFEMFERLNNSPEYPGSGIGLAICQKIVTLHQGRIWLESQLGVGTTFYFTLPK